MDTTVSSIHHLMDILPNLLLFFGIAGIAVPVLQRFRLSPVLGYLLCGLLVGPNGVVTLLEGVGWLHQITVQETQTVQILGELGIISLMFMIGLELSFKKLKELGRYIFGLGSAQILTTALVIFLIASMFQNSNRAAILIGASLALSSTAIVMQLLEERRLVQQSMGILCFSILLMQDLAVIPILVLVASFSGETGASLAGTLGTAVLAGMVTVGALYLAGRVLLPILLRSVNRARSPEWLAAFVVFVVIAFAILTQSAGLSLALGAFIAGLLIAETEFRHEVEVIINPLKGMLLGIFFLSVGMLIDVREVAGSPLLIAASVLGIYAVKILILFPLCRVFRVPGRQAMEVSIYLAQPGEFALLILGMALSAQLMPVQDVQFFLMVTAIAMMLSPLLFQSAPYAGAWVGRLLPQRQTSDAPPSPEGQKTILIAGCGRVGMLLGQALHDQKIPYVAFDSDAQQVQALKSRGFRIIYGDARKKDLWKRLVNAHDVAAAVIAIDDHDATRHILAVLRTQAPVLPVIVRAKDASDTPSLCSSGAQHVVAETLESSLRIVQLLLNQMGIAPVTAQETIERLRQNGAQAALS